MDTPDSVLGVRVLSSARVFPESPVHTYYNVPLSIIDATVVNFSSGSVVSFYDRPTHSVPDLPSRHLRCTLEKTLNAYPLWCGQLQWAPYKAAGNHTQRFGRLNLTYGTKADPGVEYVVAESS